MSFAAYSAYMKRLDDKRHCRLMHIMVTRAQVPVCLKAGGFIVLSFETYASVTYTICFFFIIYRLIKFFN